jgi:site-specific recombinase XerD
LAGLRCEEIVTLRVDDVDLETGRVTVIGKGDKQREVPLVTRLRETLGKYLAVRSKLIGRPLAEVYRRTPSSVWRIRPYLFVRASATRWLGPASPWSGARSSS